MSSGTAETHTHPHGEHDHPHPHEGGHAHGEHGHEHPHPEGHEQEHGDHGHDHPHGDHGHDHGDHGHSHGDGDHDHMHGTGLWAQIKHAITPHSHDASEAIQTAEEARTDGIRTAWIGLVGMLVVAAAQVFIVAISGSVGLLADTVHSLGHAVTTIPLIIAFRIGARQATKRYPYGYRRAEDLVGILICLVIFASAMIILWESIRALTNPRPLTNLVWVFAAGIVGFLGNEIVAIYRIRGGKRIGSAALIAEGQHARADGFTSLAVAVGITFAWFGFPQVDAIVGIFIAVVILGIMFSSLRQVIRRLMDGVDPGLVDQLSRVVSAVPGVEGLGRTRARWSGHRIAAETVIEIEPTLSVSQSQDVVTAVQEAVRGKVRHVDDIFVEVRPAGVAASEHTH